uniref:Uncharacterized protein n=1 Tax=Rousettus aegyptiacus TaxID=9407 RepID=A0A7J8K8H2_ROUAE|nr:hypothetical protein HJG63_005134 [Rousettus aegyptiacus]
MEGDSFFDDPIPKPEKTYGWPGEPSKQGGSLAALSDAPAFKSGPGALPGAPSSKDSEGKRGNTVLKDLKLVNDKIGSLGLVRAIAQKKASSVSARTSRRTFPWGWTTPTPVTNLTT